MSWARTYSNLRSLSDDELIAAHDEVGSHAAVGVSYYLDELRRREAERQGERMERLTETMQRLTWVIAGLTLIAAGASVAAVIITLAH